MATNSNNHNDASLKEEAHARLDTELEILYAMYPDGQLTYSSHGREVHFHNNGSAMESAQTSSSKASLVLRIPELYPVSGLPEVLSASRGHRDLREETRQALSGLGVSEGEEILDALILAFQDLIESAGSNRNEDTSPQSAGEQEEGGSWTNKPRSKNEYKTVIIWLHHLLNTNKRKLALNPELSSTSQTSSSSATQNQTSRLQTTTTNPSPLGAAAAATRKQTIISGFSKPGYPGIMIFSGPRDLVAAHVSQLRAQRWQAFQIRYDSDEDVASNTPTDTGAAGRGANWPPPGLWEFDDVVTGLEVVFEARMGSMGAGGGGGGGGGGSAIQEVESISILAKHIRDQKNREVFLGAIGVK